MFNELKSLDLLSWLEVQAKGCGLFQPKKRPKQFISLFGDLSLFDLTLQRINNRDIFKKPIIVTSEEYLPLVEESLSKTGVEEKVYLEPESKNTFPALVLPVIASNEVKKKKHIWLCHRIIIYLSINHFMKPAPPLKINLKKMLLLYWAYRLKILQLNMDTYLLCPLITSQVQLNLHRKA